MALIQGSGAGGGNKPKPKKEEKKPKTVNRGTAQAFNRSRRRSPSGEASNMLQRELGYEPPPVERYGLDAGTGHRGDVRGGQAVMADEMALDRLEERLALEEARLAKEARTEQYGGTPLSYNIPQEGDTRKYGTDERIKQSGVVFRNPDGLPVPDVLKQTIYAAMMKVPYFAQYTQSREGQRGNPIEIVLGSSTNDVGTALKIKVADAVTGGETAGVYSNLGPLANKIPGFKPTIHVMVPEQVFKNYEQGMETSQKAKAQGSKHWKEYRRTAEESFRGYANDVLIHEVGHHVDQYMKGLSSTPEWNAIWEDPKARQSTGEYGATLRKEMFAEAFKEYVNSPVSRDSMDPRIRAFMDEFISPVLPRSTDEHPQKTAGYARELAKEAVRRYARVRKAYMKFGPDIDAIAKELRSQGGLQ